MTSPAGAGPRSERFLIATDAGAHPSAIRRHADASHASAGVACGVGGEGKTLGDFPADAQLFCVIDAAFLEPARPRAEPPLQPAEPQAPPAPPPAAPAPTEPAQRKAPRTGPGRQ